MKKLASALLLIIPLMAMSQPESEIRGVLAAQQDCWNAGDIPCFMEGYWKSDQLVFVGKDGLTYGWQTTLERYQKNYPDKVAMGQLTFDILEIYPLSADYWFVIGKWSLERSAGNVAGHFTLLFRQMDGEWVIVSDHSS